MKDKMIRRLGMILAALVMLTTFGVNQASAHCDGMDGPVVKAAQKALEAGDVNLALIWVQQRDEAEVRGAFEHSLAVRKLGPQARELADRYFFETLVRLHRAGEGAPYTGLKPAGRDLGPVIPAADRALEGQSAEALAMLLTSEMQAGLRAHFQDAVARKDYQQENLGAGREYVKTYVEFIHYVEGIHQAIQSGARGHFRETEETAAGDNKPAAHPH